MLKINHILPDSHPFLQRTTSIAKPSKRLWYIGDINIPADRPVIAIVGTRGPTPYGKDMTYKLAYQLAKRGAVVVSGLALGVDSIAHRATLDAGGKTIAVQANGLDRLYPTQHQQLALDMLRKEGAIISEYEPGEPPMKYRFLERNRIVSALCDGVLVTEAAARSGTLATANHALEQGKALMAVPGNATSAMSAGCNQLLKTGAALVTDVQDIYDALGLFESVQASLPFAESREEQVILELLSAGVRDGELLQQKSGLSAATFAQTLSMLEISGKIRALGANHWSIR